MPEQNTFAIRAAYFTLHMLVAGMDTTSIRDVDTDPRGRSEFAQAVARLHNPFKLIRHGQLKEKRQRNSQGS